MKIEFSKALLIALILAIAIETAYLFFPDNPLSVPNVTTTVPTPGSIKSSINLGNLIYLRSLPRGNLASAVLSTTLQGEIIEVLNEPGVQGHKKYEKGLHLETDDKKSMYALYNKNEIANVAILSGQINIGFSELKPGDRVRVEEKFDLINDSSYNLIEATIVKL